LMFFLLVAALLYLLLEFYWPSQQRAETRWTALLAEVSQTRGMGSTLAELEAERDRLAAIAAAREREIAALLKVRAELSTNLEKEIERGDIAIKEIHGDLVVDLVDKILFESGDAQIGDRGKEVLCQVADSLIKIPDKRFQVAGHTDAVPISTKLVEQYPTNWELSATRATNVVRYLQEECKVPGKRLSAVGFAHYRPIASNRRSSGRRRNRRIELTLLPLKRRR